MRILIQLMLWIDENLPKEYTNPEELAAAYDCLSKADVFLGRIRRWQHWRFLVYANALATAGVATAKKEKYQKFVPYTPTTRILKLWRAKMKYMKRKAIAEKIADKTHISTRKAIQDMVPFVKAIFERRGRQAESLSSYFGFDMEEVEWLTAK